MKIKKVIGLVIIGFLFFANLGFANPNTNNLKQTTITIKPTKLIGDLKLTEKFVITPEDVIAAKVKYKTVHFILGTFCAYTNDPNREITLKATTNEGGFYMLGQNGIGKIPYNLYILGVTSLNGGQLAYDYPRTYKLEKGKDNSHIGCENPEKIQIIFHDIDRYKAGTYDVSLNLEVFDL